MFNTNPWLYYSTTSNKLTNTYIQGILDTSGNIILRNGGFSLPNGDVSMNGNLYVGLETAMRGNVNIQGNLVVNKRVLQTLKNDPSYNTVNGYYALAENVQPIVSRQTAYDIGQNWQSAVSGVLEKQWGSVCWSSQLGLFCAVAFGSDGNVAMVSRDGLNWRSSSSGITTGNWNSICWSPELGLFCAVGYGTVMVSNDGSNWTYATGALVNFAWNSVCWSPELGLFCAVGGNGSTNQRVIVSSNGLNWRNAVTGVLDNNWCGVCWAPELGLFCAVPNSGGSTNEKVMISKDGLNWRNADSGVLNSNWRSICWSPELGIFCAVSTGGTTTNNRVMVSNDGLNWRNATSGVLNTQWNSVCWAPEIGLFCSIEHSEGTLNQKVMISRDGLIWTNATSGVLTGVMNTVCWSPELSSFCAVAQTGPANERVMITNPNYRLPTTKSIQTLTNDGNYNTNIASTPSGTFPNFRTTATGPNLISIGNGNYKLVGNLLSNSIAIGNTILNVSNPSGYGMIGIGQNVFPQLTTGFQNIGIGNAIATSMATGHNNVFIGNSVATSTSSTGNTVAIGTNAGFTNASGINNTYLGAFTGANAGAYSNSTAIGYGATITASNQIKLGTANETTNIDGNLVVDKTIQTTNLSVSGTTSLSSITQSGNLIVNNTTPSYNVNSGSFQLKGGAGILGNVFINQNLSVAQNSTFSGNVSLNGIQNTFTVDVSMNGNLQVNKTSIFNGNVVINGNTTFTKDVSMNSNLQIPNNATVGGDVSMNGNLYVGKISTFIGNVSISGFSNLRDASMNGNLYVSGQTTLVGNVNIQGNLVVNKRVLQTLSNDPSYNNVNGYYALAENVQPIVSKQTAYDIGQNWQSASTGIAGVTVYSVCWSPELSLYCIGAHEWIMTSNDGLTWNRIYVGANPGLSANASVCWSAELGLFCVVGFDGGRVAVSSNGITWTLATSRPNININWNCVCWSRELGIFCAVSSIGAGTGAGNDQVMISSNGTTWSSTNVSNVLNVKWVSVCWSAELGLFCATAVQTGTTNQRVMVSRNGLYWRNAVSGVLTNDWVCVCWAPELGLFCAVANTGTTNERVMVSSDGLYWRNAVSGVLSYNWNSVCWAPELGLFCAVATNGNTNDRVMVSSDGLNWRNASSGVLAHQFMSVCWSPQLSSFVSISFANAMITNQSYRLPTTKSIQTLTNDGNYNINIASTPSGTFPNFRTTATGPNLISIGNGNYKLVAGALRDSIAIGNTILSASNQNGYGMIGIGQNVFPQLTTGFQNIGIGNAIATSMTIGYNNVFIGNSVATSTLSTGNTVAIGTAAGRTNTTGINNTYLGAFTGASFTTYSNSTAIGYGAFITASNEIVLGTITEHIRTPGNPYWLSSFNSVAWTSFSNIVAIQPGSAIFSNRITVHNTYYLLVPEFAYGLYLVHITYNLNAGAAFNTFQLFLYQYAFANATTANVPSGNNPANSFLIRSFETIITGTSGTLTNLNSSMSASYLFEYAPGTTNRAFTFGWLTGAINTTANNDGFWNWISIHKVA